MIGLGAPWWLIALTAIPLIRWLHRWQAPLVLAPVSAVFLWESAESLSDGGESPREPDPAWRRRAIIASLLILALAQPWWQRDSGAIVIWVDDSVSMSTVEEDRTRLAGGLDSVNNALQHAGAVRVTLRSLSNPARAVPGDAADALHASRWLDASTGEPEPPPAVALRHDEAHWLVTDGANERVVEWASAAPLSRIFHAGSATENVALTKLAARPRQEDPDALDLLIAISNQGREDATRNLILESGTTPVETRMIALGPGETRYVRTSLPRNSRGITALISPRDALSTDDSLTLAASAIAPSRVSLDPACPAELSLAIRLHPSLVVIAMAELADLQIACSEQSYDARAVLRFHTSAPMPVEAPLEWRPGLGRLRDIHLQSQWIAAAAWDTVLDRDYETLLASDGHPLLIRRSGPPTIVETVIDMSQSVFARQPEYTAAVNALIDLSLGRSSLDTVAASNREPAASYIAPTELSARPVTQHSAGVVRWPLADILLAIAAIALCSDTLLLWRAYRKSHHG